jgi:peptidyl-prolyl cis-trans isomerase D
MFRRLMRSNALRSRWAWIIFGILVLPFILFFSPAGGDRFGAAAGTLFGKRVPLEVFEDYRQWVATLWGDAAAVPAEQREAWLTQFTWERLAVLEEAKRRRIQVTDADVAAFIRGLPAFQENGRFAPPRYYGFLGLLRATPKRYEDFVRKELMIERLIAQVREAPVEVGETEVTAAYLRAQERRRIALLTWPTAAYLEPAAAALTDEDVRAHYAASPELVRRPAQVTFELLGLTREEAAAQAEVDEEAVAQYYADRPEEFLTEAGEPRPLADVREEILGRLRTRRAAERLTDLAIALEAARAQGDAFEAMAAAAALTPRTVGPLAVGDVWVSGAPEPAVLQAAYALGAGGISDVLETNEGVHVLRVTQREPERIPPFEEVAAQVRADLLTLRTREAARAEAARQRQATADALAQGRTIEEAAQAAGAPLRRPAPFTREEAIEGLGYVPAVHEAIFAADAGTLTDVLEGPEAMYAAHVEAVLPADPAGLTEAERTRLSEQLQADRRRTRETEWLTDLWRRAELRSFLTGSPAP